MRIKEFQDGYALCCDSTSGDAYAAFMSKLGVDTKIPLIVTDPPYGNIVSEGWDRVDDDDEVFSDWMVKWTRMWAQRLVPGGAFYVFGGVGRPGFRPFFKYLTKAEDHNFQLANLITWGKRRAYGLSYNYLFTREELAYFVNGDYKKPRCFNVPLLETKRGYAGYNKKYPAKSEYFRRSNVWTDINEIFRGKVHPTQKPQRIIEVPIEVHTNPGEWVLDPFAGSGVTAHAARKLGRKFVVFENDEACFEKMIASLR